MNQPTIEQLLIKADKKLLVFEIEALQNLKKELAVLFTRQLNKLRGLGGSESQLSELKNVYTVEVREISSKIFEAHKKLSLLANKFPN